MERDREEAPEEDREAEERGEGDEARGLDVSGHAPDDALEHLSEEREALEARLVVGGERIDVRVHDAGEARGEGQVVVPDVERLRERRRHPAMTSDTASAIASAPRSASSPRTTDVRAEVCGARVTLRRGSSSTARWASRLSLGGGGGAERRARCSSLTGRALAHGLG